MRLVKTAVEGYIDYGWAAYEVVPEFHDDKVGIAKIKQLIQDHTDVLVNVYNGEYIGLRQTDYYGSFVDIGVYNSLLCYFDIEGTYWYGVPLLENVRSTYLEALQVQQAANRYDRKVAGTFWVITYPVGATPYDGVITDNFLIAKRLLTAIESNGHLVIPRVVARYIDELNEQQDGPLDSVWKVELLTDSGQGASSFPDRLRYFDTLKVRTFGIPERAVLEGNFGTKAESEAQADFAIVLQEMRHAMITECVNQQTVDWLLTINWGESYAGTVYVKPTPLMDDKRMFLRDLYTQLLSNPMAGAEVATIDFKSLRDALGVPETTGDDTQGAAGFYGVDPSQYAPDDPLGGLPGDETGQQLPGGPPAPAMQFADDACGADAPGGGGFQKGNKCAAGDGAAAPAAREVRKTSGATQLALPTGEKPPKREREKIEVESLRYMGSRELEMMYHRGSTAQQHAVIKEFQDRIKGEVNAEESQRSLNRMDPFGVQMMTDEQLKAILWEHESAVVPRPPSPEVIAVKKEIIMREAIERGNAAYLRHHTTMSLSPDTKLTDLAEQYGQTYDANDQAAIMARMEREAKDGLGQDKLTAKNFLRDVESGLVEPLVHDDADREWLDDMDRDDLETQQRDYENTTERSRYIEHLIERIDDQESYDDQDSEDDDENGGPEFDERQMRTESAWSEHLGHGNMAHLEDVQPIVEGGVSVYTDMEDDDLESHPDILTDMHAGARLVGAEPGANVYMTKSGNTLKVKVRHEDYEQDRSFDMHNMIVYNHETRVASDMRGQGFGGKILKDQVDGASAAGFKEIQTYAARDDSKKGYNGYYTWPALGTTRRY